MTYEKFKELIQTEIKESLGEKFSLSIETIQRNNNTKYQGLCIKHKGCNISPVIPLDTFYKQYQCCQHTISEITDQILDKYKVIQIKNDFDISMILNYSSAKKKIQARLLNTEKNAELLENIPHRNICDLSVVYYIQLSLETGCSGGTLISNSYLNKWNVTESELFEQAKENMKNDGLLLNLFTLVPITVVSEDSICAENKDFIYILTNKNKLLGATQILNKEFMYYVKSVIQGDFLIIPSSTHELILLPASASVDIAELSEILSYNNATLNLPDENLSNHIYHYSYETDKITILK